MGARDESRVIAVVLGASRFPCWPAVDNERLGEAFANSKRDLVRLLYDNFASEVLDRFDALLSPNALCQEIERFLERHGTATDLIVYYVGHGGFLEDQSYYLALPQTATDREHATALRAADLAQTLKTSFRHGRTFLVLDCCFGGSAVPLLQGPIGELLEQQAAKGVAVLNAASKDKAAIVPPGATRTMFSDCFCDVLSKGIAEGQAKLSLREVRQLVIRRIGEKYPTETKAWPEVHTPRQAGGSDVADFPLFPNRSLARTLEPLQSVARQRPTPTAGEGPSLLPLSIPSEKRDPSATPRAGPRGRRAVYVIGGLALCAGAVWIQRSTVFPEFRPVFSGVQYPSPTGAPEPSVSTPPTAVSSAMITPPLPTGPPRAGSLGADHKPYPRPTSRPIPTASSSGTEAPIAHQTEPAHAAHTRCSIDSFTGALRPVSAGSADPGPLYPCERDDFTGGWRPVPP
ncbi:MAG: hypothetical protein JOZ69_14620 [Myxococcales bacterium]|nr:hypothetical protein [Myxococcales bacterium]